MEHRSQYALPVGQYGTPKPSPALNAAQRLPTGMVKPANVRDAPKVTTGMIKLPNAKAPLRQSAVRMATSLIWQL